MTTPVGHGSPEATPRVNGSCRSLAPAVSARGGAPTTSTPVARPVVSTVRRVIGTCGTGTGDTLSSGGGRGVWRRCGVGEGWGTGG